MTRNIPLARKTPLKRTAGLSAGAPQVRRKAVYRRDSYHCALCDDGRKLQLHHVISRAQGGPDTEMNLVTLCPRCHAAAHGHDIDRLGLTADYVEQCIVEYLSDLYACEGLVWNPWSKEEVTWKW